MIIFALPAMLLLICSEGSGQQLNFNNCNSYIQINASDYDRNPASSNPLGYYASTLPYTDGKKVTPCVSVTGIPSTAYVEIKCEMDTNGARICVGDQGGTLRECGNGRLRSCSLATATSVKFAFYCDSACEQVDIPFRYRFVMSEANPSDQWCEGRPSDDYPSSLITAPPNVVTPPAKKNVKGRGSICEPSIYLSILSIALLLVSLHTSW